MRITYTNFPVLRWYKKPSDCRLAPAPTEPRLGIFIRNIIEDPRTWCRFFSRQVDFMSRTFANALIKSTDAFSRVVNAPDFRIPPCAGTLLSEQFGTILYTCDEDELHCWQLRGNIVMAASVLSFRDHNVLALTEPGLRAVLKEGLYGGYEATDNEIGSFLTTVIVTYLLMLRYAKVDTVSTYPRQSVLDDDTTEPRKVNGRQPTEPAFQNLTDIRITYRTSRWFTAICRNEDFAVRGHFRLQPKKNDKGERIHELIYIKPFIKHGYHRQAQVTQQQTTQP